MKIAVYTLTRDRLDYTKHCFASLKEKAWGYPFDHFVLDNGSQDGTPEWLREEYKPHFLHRSDTNVGISRASNFLLYKISEGNYDLIIKMDNDCEVVSDNILQQMVEIFTDAKKPVVLSPRVVGINRQPTRVGHSIIGGRDIGWTSIVGGLFHVVPSKVYREYAYPTNLPPAWGQDDDFCRWANSRGIRTGYVEGLVVNHYETTNGQAARYPEYFERKKREESKL